jgi:hypothetical protein
VKKPPALQYRKAKGKKGQKKGGGATTRTPGQTAGKEGKARKDRTRKDGGATTAFQGRLENTKRKQRTNPILPIIFFPEYSIS